MINKLKEVIICVDDEKFVLDTLNSQLQKKFGDKYDYEFTERAEEAIELIGQLAEEGRRVVMIISDQIMPGMTGDQFLTHIHKEHPYPVKILLTGQASLEAAVNVINNAHLYRYIPKPWNQEDLLLTVEKGLEQYKLLESINKQATIFRKFVPQQFIEALNIAEVTDIKLGDQAKRGMSILFSDIRNFTSMSEKMSPEDNYAFINSYLKYVEPAIQNNNGFVDKFIGDAVMALFYQPIDAVKAAIDVQRALVQFNIENSNYNFVRSGIGVHAGDLMLGIIGTDIRMQGTVISKAVNLASRVQDLAAAFANQILITEEVFKQIRMEDIHVDYRLLGKAFVKGKTDNIVIYEILDKHSENNAILKIETNKEFQEGLSLFLEQKFAESCVAFKAVVEKNRDDKVAAFYLSKAANYMLNTDKDEHWTGFELT